MVSFVIRWTSWVGRSVASITSSAVQASFIPAVCTALVLVAWQQATRATGVSFMVQGALGAAALLGVVLAQTGPIHWLGARVSPRQRMISCWLLLAAWGLAGPWHAAAWSAVLDWSGCLSAEFPLRNALVIGAVALPLLAVPFALVGSVMFQTVSRGRPRFTPELALGSAAGVAGAMLLGTFCGIDLLAVLLGSIAAILAIRCAIWSETKPVAELRTPEAAVRPVADICEVLVVLGLGCLLAVNLRIVQQLSITSVAAQWSLALPVLLGLAAGLKWAGPCGSSAERPYVWSASLAAAGSLGLLGLFSACVFLSLWMNAYISWPEVLWVCRGGLALPALAPCGVALGVCFASRAGESNWRIVRVSVFAGLGYWLAVWGQRGVWRTGLDLSDSVGDLGYSTSTWCLAASALVVIAALVQALSSSETGSLRARLAQLVSGLQGSRWQRIAAAGLATMLLITPFCRGQFDPAVSARMLFTTNAFLAYRSGFESRLLPHLDSGRLVGGCESDQGTLTVWRQGGAQLHLRENGIPVGILSVDPDVSPQFSPEVLQVVFPLILHHQPDSLLVLGLGGGSGIETGLEFPLRRFTCAEGDSQLVRMVSRMNPGRGPLTDERLTLWPVDPTLALAGTHEQFDVIVSAPGQPATVTAQPCFAPEFYRRSARCLTTDGIFCQRLQAIDLGAEPVRSLLRSVRPAFAEVMIIEVAHSEFLLLGTNSPKGLVREELLARAQTEQVRRVVAELGLDWSILLDFPAWRDADVRAFAAASEGLSRWLPGSPSGLALAMPREVMRWGPKQEELHAALSPHMGRLLNWMGEEAENKELLRRLGEVTGQHKLKTVLADQYWAYRQSLREQVSKNSVTMIRQASVGADDLADEDRRRISYFKALSRAVKTREPTDVRRMTAFARPYDPLLSDFVHFEAAELYAKAEPRNTALELRHRLHTVFYASPLDGTVRSVTAALKLLNEHPEAEPSARIRWDLCNALLESLQQRWDVRRGQMPRSIRDTLRDIDVTLVVAEQTLAMMDGLTPEAGLPAELWVLRRRVFEKNLLSPVQSYRIQLQRYDREKPLAADKQATPPTP